MIDTVLGIEEKVFGAGWAVCAIGLAADAEPFAEVTFESPNVPIANALPDEGEEGGGVCASISEAV